MTLRFRRSLEELLEEWCPPDGMAALLLEHPTGGIYFPLVVKPLSVGTDYYSLPMRFDDESPRTLQLEERSSPASLALRGRLELTHPALRLPLWQELTPLHEEEAEDDLLRVLLLRSAPGKLPQMEHRNLTTLKRLVPLLCQNWIEHAGDLGDEPEFRDCGTLARDIVRRLSDEEQDPPYYPILHAEVSPDPAGSETRYSSANLLSWNCLLLDRRRGTPAYIPEMPSVMLERGVSEWWDDVTRRRDFNDLAESIRDASMKTIDHVRVLGRCRHQGRSWWAFVRQDKDRNEMGRLLAEWSAGDPILAAPSTGAELQELSVGDLVRRALTVKAADDDVLMTAWLVSEDRQALNMGFRAGRKMQVLDHSEVAGPDSMEIIDYPPFRVRLSPLPQADRRLIEERIRPVLARAARAARRIDGSGLIERTFEPIRKELQEGSWHENHAGGGLFPAGFHDVADWSAEDIRRCHARMVAMLERLLRDWTGRQRADPSTAECSSRFECWHIRALKALAHDRLHSSLVMAVLAGDVDDQSFLMADREICLHDGVRWAEVLAALQTVTTEGNRFQFKQCFHGQEQTLILRFSGDLTEKGVAAALVGNGDSTRK
ncbi:MAG: hypothetical protein ACE5ID_11215, partial [Acidobacteriota bacterium]